MIDDAVAGRRGGRRRRGGGRPHRGAGDRVGRQVHAAPARRAGRAGRGGRRRGAPHRRGGQRGHAGADAVAVPGGRGAVGRPARPGGRPRGRGGAARRHRAGRPAGHHVPGRRRQARRPGRSPRSTASSPYAEGTFIGYRGHFAGRAPAPAFWLGHGLGLRHLGVLRRPSGRRATRRRHRDRDQHRRTGPAARSCRSTCGRPSGTSRCAWSAGPPSTVAPGESAQVTVTTDDRLWRKWDTAAGSWDPLARRRRVPGGARARRHPSDGLGPVLPITPERGEVQPARPRAGGRLRQTRTAGRRAPERARPLASTGPCRPGSGRRRGG